MAEFFDDHDVDDWAAYERETEDRARVKSAAIYVQANIDRALAPVAAKHHVTPWGKVAGRLHFRPGEVTVWGGENGAGKSLVTGQTALSLCGQDARVCIASFEMKPAKTVERMGRQWTHASLYDPAIMGNDRERRILLDRYDEFKHWTNNRLWLYDQQGTVKPNRVFAVARYAARELRVNHIFIDNLAKCVKGEDDFNGQKEFMDEVCAIARDEDIHIHIVHHVKKPATPNGKPDKYAFKGSGSITDQPDNVIAVWRNRAKERTGIKSVTDPDTVLIVDKQRNGEWEGEISLWYHHHSQQFLGSHDEGPMEFYL